MRTESPVLCVFDIAMDILTVLFIAKWSVILRDETCLPDEYIDEFYHELPDERNDQVNELIDRIKSIFGFTESK